MLRLSMVIILVTGMLLGANSAITPDRPVVEEEDEAQYKELVERVLIHLRNVPAGSRAIPGSQGLIKLERRRFRQEAQTLDAMAGFFNVPVNQGYTVSGFHRSNSQAFDQPLELWGIWKDLHIHGSQNEFTFVRKMPYILDVQPSFDRPNSANPSLQTGEQINFDLLMHNPSAEDYRARVVLLLKNTSTGKIHELEKEVLLAARSRREYVSLQFTAHEAGEYHFAAGIFLRQRINHWTDCWDWSRNPLFYVTPQHRSIEFAGYTWDVKAGFGNPGGNLWSNDTTQVFVDESGALHLHLKQKANGRWYASEVISQQTFKYGTYTFYLDADPAAYDPHVVAGIFLYRDELNEIDLEFSRWGDQNNYQFGNYVIQPAEYPGNQFRFPVISSGTHTTHRIVWKPGEVHFYSWHGHYPDPPEGRMIAQWQYSGQHVPKPNGLRLFFNIWLFRGIDPRTDKTETLIINYFTFQPLETDE